MQWPLTLQNHRGHMINPQPISLFRISRHNQNTVEDVNTGDAHIMQHWRQTRARKWNRHNQTFKRLYQNIEMLSKHGIQTKHKNLEYLSRPNISKHSGWILKSFAYSLPNVCLSVIPSPPRIPSQDFYSWLYNERCSSP